MSNSQTTSKLHIFAKDFFIPILAGLIGISGSLWGVTLANTYSAKQAEIQKSIEFDGKILDQRIALIDRASKIFGKSPGLKDHWSSYLQQQISIGEKRRTELSPAVLEKLTEAHGEFQSVIILAAVYFGPETRKALKDLSDISGPWWEKPKDKQDELIAAMSREIKFGLTTLPWLKSANR